MTREECGKFIGKTIQNAVESGCHQLDIVAILEAHKHSLLTQAYEANKGEQPKSRIRTLLDGGGN